MTLSQIPSITQRIYIDTNQWGNKTMRLRGFLGRCHVKKKENDCFDGTNLEQG
jgi:hypothetical protein